MSDSFDPPSLFQEIDRFLGSFDVAAVAHARSELSDGQKALLAQMAEGALTDERRKEAMQLMAGNTTALEFLADLLKNSGSPDEEGVTS